MRELTPEERRKFIIAAFEELVDTPEVRDYMQRKYIEPARKEARERGRKIAREIMRMEARKEARKEGKRIGQLFLLLHTLRRSSITLAKRHVRKLERMSFEELPDVDVAKTAWSAEGFVRAANLDG